MKNLLYILCGMLFGVTLYKGEIISWYRIQEMFRFHSFHMFGVIMTAIATGALSVAIMKRALNKEGGPTYTLAKKPYQHGLWIGGLIFGIGWALTGACPGPLWVHVGVGTLGMLVTLFCALVGVVLYSMVESKLPR